jgi:predicted RNase H-like nuclease
VQKKLGVRIVLVDETTGQIIIPEKKENVEQKKADRR